MARVMQNRPGEMWMNIGVDRYLDMVPARFRPGLGLRPGAQRPDLEDGTGPVFDGLYASVAAHAGLGFNVVVDVGHHHRYCRRGSTLIYPVRQLAGLAVWWVGIRCPVSVIQERRRLTGYPVGEAEASWEAAVHDAGLYDLVVDRAAEAIYRQLGGPPAAMTEIARWIANRVPSRGNTCDIISTSRPEDEGDRGG